MARFLKGIIGAYSGKVGNVIGSSWRNVTYVRSLPRPSNKPASPLQLAQREKFSLVMAFLNPLKDLLNIGYSDIMQTSSTGYNQAMREALKFGVKGDYPNQEIDYANIRISKGSLAKLADVEWHEANNLELAVSWEQARNRFMGNGDDSVILLVYNIDKQTFDIVEDSTREEGSVAIEFPESYSGNTLVGWVFAGHRDGIKTSNSQYLGEIVLS